MARPLALVHDYLTQRGGAERVVAAWCEGFPDAPLYTALYEPATTFSQFADHDVKVSWLNHLGVLRREHRLAFPLLAPTMSHWHIDADVVLASSSGWAHGVRTNGRLVVYCHAPARWLYQSDRYLNRGSMGARAKIASRVLSPGLRRWDQRAEQRADTYVTNSRYSATMIEEIYQRSAQVIAPPVRNAPDNIVEQQAYDVLVVARLLPYKNIDLVLDAAALATDMKFRVVGDGPLRDQLRQRATSNVSFAGVVNDDALWSEYRSASVHLALSHEDFGITPLEAASTGRPTVARASGGYLDTISASTGILIDEADLNARAVVDALKIALSSNWDETALRAQARSFSAQSHLEKIRELVTSPATPQ
jgi:glycosyltransferase involved in cell wall biosynthesis